MIQTSAVSASAGASTSPQGASSVTDPQAAQDRFMKLLVAQLNNQDPMNPMDNAQMTSQMAQINTVTGIQQLNQTMQSMSGQFTAMQMLQGTSMIGRSVLTTGNTLGSVSEGKHAGAFDLQGTAASVKVSITTPGGQLVDTIDLGSAQPGRNYFNWSSEGKYEGDVDQLRFSVQATNGQAPVAASTLSPHTVVAASNREGRLSLELDNGKNLAFSDVQAVY